MTRTERSAFPRAVIKDRSESRSGLNKALRKNGGGQHNWGSLADEGALEYTAIADEELESSFKESPPVKGENAFLFFAAEYALT
jgi:hypothetical protein